MSDPEKAPSRGEILKQLRVAHAETVSRTQALLKEQQQIEKEILKAVCEAPQTVIEVAEATGIPAHQVLWYLAALKKYNRVVEKGMRGDYPLYQKSEEA